MIVLLDIEGTICPITFVKDVLYPYFTNKLPTLLSQLQFPLDPANDYARVLLELPEEVRKLAASIQAHFDDLVRRDIKDPVLKLLQGLVWKTGYEQGEITAPVYPDAIDYLKTTDDAVYIYSLGSVQAQHLLFRYVDDNGTTIDLNPRLRGYYDIPLAGYKTKAASYTHISSDIGVAPNQITFLSDNEHEVAAATAAGMTAVVMVRPGNAPLSDDAARFRSARLMPEALI